jgi:hypothetical protein
MKRLGLSLSIFAAAFIIGCGGEGGSSGSTNDNAEGNVALGPISDANVSIYDLNGNKIYSTVTFKISKNDEINNALVPFSK